MQKILIVASVASMIDQFLMPYIEEYTTRGWDVVVATNFENPGTITNERVAILLERLEKLTVKTHQIDFERSPLSIGNIKAYQQLKLVMNNKVFDIIHAHSPIGGLLTRLVAKFNKNQWQAKIFYTAHGFHFYEGAPLINWAIYYPIEKWLARYTDALITINEQDYQLAKIKFKTRKSNGVYKVNGVGIDLNEYTISGIVDTDFKRSLGIPNSNFVITIIGELNQNKNQSQMIEALEKLNDSTITLLLIGQGPKYTDFQERFKNNSNVKVLGYRSDIKAILNITDCVGSMSYREGLPKNVMEAMTAGKPVIATNIRGNQDLVVDGETGYLVAVNDVESVVEAIEKIKNEENQFGENAKKMIQHFSIEEVIEKIDLIIKNE